MATSGQYLEVGEISGVFGIKGWVKVFSFTEPRENILNYSPWLLQKGQQSKQVQLIDGQLQGRSVIAQIENITDRDMAAALQGYKILIDANLLPEPDEGEYYWRDLIGLQVETTEGIGLGAVDYLLETGANDVLVVKDGDKERLVPFLQQQTVLKVDLPNGKIIVDWDTDF